MFTPFGTTSLDRETILLVALEHPPGPQIHEESFGAKE
jgi:hypothetical protein